MVLPPCTDQGISPYQGLVMPFNYRSKYHKLYFIDNKALFSNYCLNFLINMIYIYLRKFYGHSLRLQIYKKCEVNGEASKKRKKTC